MEIKTRFALGDTVWALKNGKAISFEIKSICLSVSVDKDCGYVFYNSDEGGTAIGETVTDHAAYASKEELIAAIFG